MKARNVIAEALRGFMPPPKFSIADWAASWFHLSVENTAEAGLYNPHRAPFQRGPMNAISDPNVNEVVLVWGSQLGKTTIELAAIGAHVDQDPCPILIGMPTEKLAEAWSLERLAPMIRDSARLRSKLKKHDKGAKGKNTNLTKTFAGGAIINLIGSNSPSDLSFRPIRLFVGDEIDRWSKLAGGEKNNEGDPVNLAIARTQTYREQRKIVLASSPTIKGASRIWRAWLQTDQRFFHVPCPHCEAAIILRWRNPATGEVNLVWQRDENGAHLPNTAKFRCEACGDLIDERHKPAMLARGDWVASNPASRKAGFWLSALYSPWYSWAAMAQEFLDAKDDQGELQVFFNTKCAELWEGNTIGVDEHFLKHRAEAYPTGTAPEGVLVVTAGIDVQDDRIEVERVGWGKGESSWSIDYAVITGNPALPHIWADLSRHLLAKIPHESGAQLRVAAAAIDTGGHHTQDVYNYVRTAPVRIIATKGHSKPSQPILSKRPAKAKGSTLRLWLIGTDTAKRTLYRRFTVEDPNDPGYCHFPNDYDLEYFKQVTAEREITKYTNGFPRRVFIKTRPRNEALDCRVGAMAALASLRVDLFKHWRKFERLIAQAAANHQDAVEREAARPAPPVEDVGHEDATPMPPPSPKVRKAVRKVRRGGNWGTDF